MSWKLLLGVAVLLALPVAYVAASLGSEAAPVPRRDPLVLTTPAPDATASPPASPSASPSGTPSRTPRPAPSVDDDDCDSDRDDDEDGVIVVRPCPEDLGDDDDDDQGDDSDDDPGGRRGDDA